MNKSDPRYPDYLEYQRAYQRERRQVDLEFRLRRNFDVYKCRKTERKSMRLRACEKCFYTTLWRNCPKCIGSKTLEIDSKEAKRLLNLEFEKQETERKARQKIAIASMLKRASELAKCSK